MPQPKKRLGRQECLAAITTPITAAPTTEWEELINSGSYGFVHRFRDEATSQSKAVKVNYAEKSMDFIGSYREIDMLKRFQHPFVIKLLDIAFDPPVNIPNKTVFKHEDKSMRQDPIYMVFEAGDYDLNDQELQSFNHIDKAIVQALLALEYLHTNHHIHRDVKPGNLVYFEETETCKLIDFGMCKPIYPNCLSHSRAITAAYRPPEHFNGKKNDYIQYGYEVDIWSLGMTWIFLLLRKEVEIEDVTPPQESLEMIFSMVPCDLSDEDFAKKFPLIPTRPTWEDLLEHFIDVDGLKQVLECMLQQVPTDRPTATDILDCSYFDDYREMIDFIRKTTSETKPSILSSYVIQGELSPERDLMIRECKESPYITKRVIFHSIEIFDRYISWRISNQIPRPNSDLIIQRARVIIYLVYKYFSIMNQCLSFNDIFEKMRITPKIKKDLFNWEKTLVKDILKFEIYRPTPYEMAKGDPVLIDEYMEKYKDAKKIHEVLVSM